MSVNRLTDVDKTNCESIGKSIADILRFSFDDEFRKSTFQLLGVSSTKDTETEISKRLMSMIQKKNVAAASKKKGKNLSKNRESMQEQSGTSESKETDDSSTTSTDCDSQTDSKRSWLQVSSEHYMNSTKRKKLNFFSQPQLSQPSEGEYPGCNAQFSNSQPSLTLHNRAMKPSSEPSDDVVSFCRKRFKESFKDNACKYLKRNSKSQYSDI